MEWQEGGGGPLDNVSVLGPQNDRNKDIEMEEEEGEEEEEEEEEP